ncbi:unnamed protein product [Peniophora sp. CBMAI 1063]|nr:unnamed protein product [Peniophora sp. CBMAI 1063]
MDDLPWPELGNVSRGATRGNQGQKGALSRPDQDGRSVLQLRVQENVLTILLNKKASEWYRTLVNEVNQALKLTKTHWRKARRRQDYDAQADQEHMELHEWLQQLKDKVMQHLELLMQRGDIKGPPYIMPDDIELTFLRKFIERQQAGIPHNPRLREAFLQGRLPAQHAPLPSTSRSGSDGPTQGSDSGWGDEDAPARDPAPPYGLPSVATMTAPSASKTTGHAGTLEEQLAASAHHLQAARAAYRRAQKTTSDVFAQYTAALEAERTAAREVALHEYRRDALVTAVIQDGSQTTQQQHQHADDAFQQPRRYSYSAEQDLARFSQWNTNGVRSHAIEHAAPLPATYRWESDERSHLPSGSHTGSPRMVNPGSSLIPEDNGVDARKRVWDAEVKPPNWSLPGSARTTDP